MAGRPVPAAGLRGLVVLNSSPSYTVLSDYLSSSFVFIYILALFRRIQVEKSRVESRGVTNRNHPTRPLDFAAQLLDFSTPELLDCLFSYTFWLCSLDCAVARTAVFAVRGPPRRSWKSRRPQNRRSALPDILYFSFVFINILALFPRFCSR